MKKLILLISAFFYLAGATGTVLHFHYCMGEETGWSLMRENKKECNKCGMEKNQSADSGCCKDEVKQAQLEVDQSTITVTWDLSPLFTSIEYPSINVQQTLADVPDLANHIGHPPLRSIPVYLFDRNFRI